MAPNTGLEAARPSLATALKPSLCFADQFREGGAKSPRQGVPNLNGRLSQSSLNEPHVGPVQPGAMS